VRLVEELFVQKGTSLMQTGPPQNRSVIKILISFGASGGD
jgi:hypothetical protein